MEEDQVNQVYPKSARRHVRKACQCVINPRGRTRPLANRSLILGAFAGPSAKMVHAYPRHIAPRTSHTCNSCQTAGHPSPMWQHSQRQTVVSGKLREHGYEQFDSKKTDIEDIYTSEI